MRTAKEFKSFQNHLKSFGACFLFRKCKVNKKRADIYARITVDGEEKHSLLKNKLMSINWNREKEVLKGNNITVKSINNHLENIRLGIKGQYRKLLDANELITAGSLKNAYLGLQTQLKGYKVKELLVKI